MDVPSPIDFLRIEDAQAWAEAANETRPWRKDFFAATVSQLQTLVGPSVSVLELGSGPGFLAERVLSDVADVTYTLLDFSPAMHQLSRARLGTALGARFVVADFKRDDWGADLGPFDAVVTVQAVHELRHKRHAVGLHQAVRGVLRPTGLYLVCDHVAGSTGMTDTELYMTVAEQGGALRAAGFSEVTVVLEKAGLVLHRGHKAA
jgi:SAM-dependent methyltransferase